MIDKKYRITRVWSNQEIKKFSSFAKGDVANVSAWKDQDKQGKNYKDYFTNAKSYTITKRYFRWSQTLRTPCNKKLDIFHI